jgi:hypothetical protein
MHTQVYNFYVDEEFYAKPAVILTKCIRKIKRLFYKIVFNNKKGVLTSPCIGRNIVSVKQEWVKIRSDIIIKGRIIDFVYYRKDNSLLRITQT